MNPETLQYLIFAGLIALISKGFIEWMKERKNGNPGRNNYQLLKEIKTTLDDIKADVVWTRDVHDKRDNAGALLWYVPRDWKEGIDTLEEHSRETNLLLKQILQKIQEQRL